MGDRLGTPGVVSFSIIKTLVTNLTKILDVFSVAVSSGNSNSVLVSVTVKRTLKVCKGTPYKPFL